MSEQIVSSLQDIPEYQELRELESQKAVLSEQLASDDFASPEIKAAYEQGLVSVAERSTEIALSPTLQNKIAAIGLQAIKGANQLKPLRGILPEQELTAMEDDIQSKLAAATAYYEQYGAQTELSQNFLTLSIAAGEVAVRASQQPAEAAVRRQEEPATPASTELPSRSADSRQAPTQPAASRPEAPSSIKQVTLIFSPSGVSVGKKGQFIPYQISEAVNALDFSQECRKALRFLAENGHAEFTPYQVWAAASEGGEFSKKGMAHVRSWLENITFRHQKIINHNGMRGPNSRYRVSPAFQVETTEGDDRPDALVPSAKKAEAEEPKTPLAEQTIGDLKLGSLYILAHKLSSLEYVLTAYDKPSITTELVQSLKDYQPDLSMLDNDEQKLLEYREAVLDEVQAVFEDEEKFIKLIECLGENTAATEFVEYLTDLLDKPEDLQFVNRLIGSKKISTQIDLRGKGVLDGTAHEIVDRQQHVIWPIPKPTPVRQGTQTATPPLVKSTVERSRAETSKQPKQAERTQPRAVAAKPKPASAAAPVRRSSRKSPKRHAAGEKKKARLQAVEDRATEIAQTFGSAFGHDKQLTINQLESIFTGFGRMALSASDSNPQQRGNVTQYRGDGHVAYGLREVIHIVLQNNQRLRPTVAQKTNKREVDEIYTRVIDAVASSQ